MKNVLPLYRARAAANNIVQALAPFCERIEIVGSIRRERPFCGDVDLVALPSNEPALRDRILHNKHVIQNGPQNVYVRLSTGLEVNVFIARPAVKSLFETTPTNFGSLMLLRTGSRAHNIYLVEYAKHIGAEWKTHEGLFVGGKLVASATEEEIFAALGLDFIPPNRRER